ncbi:MAG TPA: hypothetical protein VFZ25_00305 [Chloroflexota bacterium]|nr:hypothetical protein [Chloroflexota bacterium]
MSHLTRLLAAVGLVVATLAILVPTAALAHEKRVVGKYTFVVGFLNEPSIQNQPNGLDLTITDAQGNPVEGAEKTLKVAVSYSGGPAKDLPLRARFGLKGKYTADLIPTKAGSYSFAFSGSLNGDPVSATFQSGPNTFDDVESPADLQFPVAVPAPADLAQQTQDANANAQAALQRATLFGLAGIAVGLVGIIVGGVALVTRSHPDTNASPETPVAKAEY